MWRKVKVGLSPLPKQHPYRGIIYVQHYIPQLLLIAVFTLMLPGSIYDPITQRYTLSRPGVILQFKILYKFSSQLFAGFMPRIFPPICSPNASVKNSNYREPFLTYYSHMSKIPPGIWFRRLNSSAAIDTSKKESANVSFIKVFWQLSFQRNHIFPREQGAGDEAVTLAQCLIKTVSQFEWADTQTAATSTDLSFLVISQSSWQSWTAFVRRRSLAIIWGKISFMYGHFNWKRQHL